MRHSTLGRGLAALIHEVPEPADGMPYTSHGARYERPQSLTPTPLRLHVRAQLDKLSTRPRVGLNAARAYLDKLRQEAGRTTLDLDISKVDLTNRPMLSLTRERITTQTRYQFFVVSIWK